MSEQGMGSLEWRLPLWRRRQQYRQGRRPLPDQRRSWACCPAAGVVTKASTATAAVAGRSLSRTTRLAEC